jgi:hypothetical protein
VDKALELKVIEIIAKDLADLQQQLDGRVVERCGGEGPPGTPSDGPSRIGREASATSSSFTSSKVSIPMRSQWSPPAFEDRTREHRLDSTSIARGNAR